MAMTTVVDFLDEESRLTRRAVSRARGELARAAEALPDALAEANADPTEVLAQLVRVGAPADLLEVAAEILGLEDRAEPVDADPGPFGCRSSTRSPRRRADRGCSPMPGGWPNG